MEFLPSVKQKQVIKAFYLDGLFLFMVKFINSHVQLSVRTLVKDFLCHSNWPLSFINFIDGIEQLYYWF